MTFTMRIYLVILKLRKAFDLVICHPEAISNHLKIMHDYNCFPKCRLSRNISYRLIIKRTATELVTKHLNTYYSFNSEA